MLKNYLKASVRNILYNKFYSLISILGLSLGLGMGVFSMSYLVRELSFEKCHENREYIYRLEMQYHHADTAWSSARVMAPIGEEIAASIPGVDKVAVFRHNGRTSLKIDRKTYSTGHLIYAQPDFFEVFTIPLKTGNPETSLRNPNSVLITDTIAKTYFPDRDPIGQTILLNNETEFMITGILENIPSTTQLHCDFIASYSTLRTLEAKLDSWTDNRSTLTYLLMHPGVEASAIGEQITKLFSSNVSDEMAKRYTFSLQPLNDIYYNTYFSGNYGELYPGWEPDMIVFLVGIGLFILIQSIVNFVSLSTARGADRMKEVGIRKTFGAGRTKLVAQFLGESLILTTIAMIFALPFFFIIRYGYNAIAPSAFEKSYELADIFSGPGTASLIVLLTFIVGILAGMYPALFLSRYKPISLIKTTVYGVKSRALIRKSLVVFQFLLAIIFITVTAGWYQQHRFLKDYDLGFDRENIMVLRFTGADQTAEDCTLAKNEIMAKCDIMGAARTNVVLGLRNWSIRLHTNPESEDPDTIYAKHYAVDYDFFSFYGIELIAGRGFSPDRPEDIGHTVIINESMKQELGLSNPIGYHLYTNDKILEIVGVVKDFQGTALDWSYSSTSVMTLEPDNARILCVKLKPDNMSGTITSIQTVWENLFSDSDFHYTFLDEDIRTQYRDFNSLIPLFGGLSVISIIIAGLGIFGMISYAVVRKAKETAIRKILGASMPAIFINLARVFMVPIVLASVISIPFSYLLIMPAVEESPFQVSLGAGTYSIGGILTILIALIISFYHIIKAARANPSDALRYE